MKKIIASCLAVLMLGGAVCADQADRMLTQPKTYFGEMNKEASSSDILLVNPDMSEFDGLARALDSTIVGKNLENPVPEMPVPNKTDSAGSVKEASLGGPVTIAAGATLLLAFLAWISDDSEELWANTKRVGIISILGLCAGVLMGAPAIGAAVGCAIGVGLSMI
ncbi:hypothetical protein ACFL6Y_09910 [Elusimicrobiota bacterium]